MTSHAALLVLFAFFVSVVFAVLTRDDPREQIRFGLKVFGGFAGAGLLLGWFLYPFPPVSHPADRQPPAPGAFGLPREGWAWRVVLWGPVVLYMGAIFVLSAAPSPPAPPGVSDTWLHFWTYFGLALVVLRAFAGGAWGGVTPASLAAACAVATFYGALNELYQLVVPERTAEWADVAANAAGAVLAALAAGAWSIIRRL